LAGEHNKYELYEDYDDLVKAMIEIQAEHDGTNNQ
jgi:hypothetical protein